MGPRECESNLTRYAGPKRL